MPSASARWPPSSPAEPVPRGPGGEAARFQAGPDGLAHLHLRCGRRAAGAARRHHPGHPRADLTVRESPGAVPGRHPLLQPGPRRRAGPGAPGDPERTRRQIGLPASIHATFQGTAAGLRRVAAQRAAAGAGRAASPSTSCWGCSTRAWSTPSPSSPPCPRPASARCWRCCSSGLDLSIIALIGVILLIGIVKKNAIMMIDFAIEAERERGARPAGGHPPGLPAPLPPHPHDHAGGHAGRPAPGAGRRRGRRSCAGRWASRSWAACSCRSSSPSSRRRWSTWRSIGSAAGGAATPRYARAQRRPGPEGRRLRGVPRTMRRGPPGRGAWAGRKKFTLGRARGCAAPARGRTGGPLRAAGRRSTPSAPVRRD